MKRELTTHANGSLMLAPHPHFTPPLGLCLPAGQDTSVAPPSPRTLAALFSGTSPTLPAGLNVISGTDIYVYTGTSWLNTGDYSNANSVSISGTVLIRNTAGYDIGITW